MVGRGGEYPARSRSPNALHSTQVRRLGDHGILEGQDSNQAVPAPAGTYQAVLGQTRLVAGILRIDRWPHNEEQIRKYVKWQQERDQRG